MAANRKPPMNLNEELGLALCGEALECIADLMADPGADHTPGQLARLGVAFSHIGKTLTETAKQQVPLGAAKSEWNDVIFSWRSPSQQTRVNTAYLKERFPAVNYPEMWQTVDVAGSVVIDLPFKVE